MEDLQTLVMRANKETLEALAGLINIRLFNLPKPREIPPQGLAALNKILEMPEGAFMSLAIEVSNALRATRPAKGGFDG